MHKDCLDEAVQALRDQAAEHLRLADQHRAQSRRGYERVNRVRAAAYGWASGQLRKHFAGRV